MRRKTGSIIALRISRTFNRVVDLDRSEAGTDRQVQSARVSMSLAQATWGNLINKEGYCMCRCALSARCILLKDGTKGGFYF